MQLTVNGQIREVDAPADMPLLWVLRDLLQLTGTKFGCGIAQCGACTVHVDGAPLRSCMLPVGSLGAADATIYVRMRSGFPSPLTSAILTSWP